MKKTLLFIALLFLQTTAFSQGIKREMRAAWISTVYGIDWPKATDPAATQKTKLAGLLTSLKANGINTVYFQARTIGDALYKSNLVPWSHWLTNTYGKDPGYDPLAFAIEEAHSRGMEIHVWLNPYRAATAASNIPSYASNHKAKTNPEWLLSEVNGSSTLRYLNPALAAVRNHIDDVVKELVTNYDLDGIHFDDYFYYAGVGSQDDGQFSTDPRGFTSKNDWRRDNVTLLISKLNTSIKTLKPWVKFGISPSGIYRNFTPPGSTKTAGLEHYTTHYADTKKWMEDGIIDYLVPQVYWAFSQTTANAKFNFVTDYWNSQNFTRHLFIGLGTYRVDPADGSAWSSSIATNEIKNQIDYLRNTTANVKGAAHFTTHDLISRKAGIVNDAMTLVQAQYSVPSLIPVMTWIDNIAPAAPIDLTPSLVAGKTKLTWTAPAATTDELQKVVRYAVYRSTNANIDFDNASNVIAVISGAATTYTDVAVTPGSGTPYYYAVRSLDRMSNESTESNIVPDGVTLPVQLLAFNAKKDNNRVKIEWSTASELNSDYFLIEKAGENGIFTFLDKQNSATSNSTALKNYIAWDYNPANATNYYRLTQVDKNGVVATPVVTSLNYNELMVVNVNVFPNPTPQDINFTIAGFSGTSVIARLINLNGQLIHKESFNTTNGTQQFKLNLRKSLPAGSYILSLYDKTFHKNIKVIVL